MNMNIQNNNNTDNQIIVGSGVQGKGFFSGVYGQVVAIQGDMCLVSTFGGRTKQVKINKLIKNY